MGWLSNDYKNGNMEITYLDIRCLDHELKLLIDKFIVEICYPDKSFSISKAKKYIKKFISTADIDRKKGAVAEFFLHVYLKSKEMKQECLFKNLEENSPKKGFDGVYKDLKGNVWFVESKSGDEKSCTHKGKVQEAYRDLKGKFSNTLQNDPWINAYNHLKLIDPKDSLLDRLRELSDDYDNGISVDLNEYNIIPCGTVYDSLGNNFEGDRISKDVFGYLLDKDYKNCYSICITQRALDEFEKYLDA